MSHNVQLSGVRITDLDLLAQIVKDLTKGNCVLHRNRKTFRTYPGQSNQCDHCIEIKNGSYDIGIVKNKDGTFGLLADFTMLASTSPFAAKVAQRPMYNFGMFSGGAAPTTREDYDQLSAKYATGSLMQEYVLRQAEEQAAILGRSTQRVTGKNGTVSLEIMER